MGDEKRPNTKLRHARELRGWSQRYVAERVGTNEHVVSRWESGQHKPNKYFQTELCKLFGLNAEELGFIPAHEKDETTPQSKAPQLPLCQQFLIQPSFPDVTQDIIREEDINKRSEQGISSVDAVNILLNMLADATLQEQSVASKEHQDMNVVRRQLLIQFLEATGITLLLPTLATVANVSSSVATEEFILQCASSLKGCWYLIKGKGLPIAEEILSTYTSSLTTLIQQSSHHLEMLAGLAAQAKLLQAILAMHKLNFLGREMYCHEAVKYGRLSNDKYLYAAALNYLASTYAFCYQQPEKAVSLFRQGLEVLGNEQSVLGSRLYAGLANAYAQSKAEQEAFEAIGHAHACFPNHPELDSTLLYADHGQSNLYMLEGRMYLDLAVHYPHRKYAQKAFDAFSQSIELPSTSERGIAETTIYQADAARGAGDLDRYVTLLTEGAQMARSLDSQKRYSEAFDIFQRTPFQWRNERSIQQLAKEVFQELPRKAKN